METDDSSCDPGPRLLVGLGNPGPSYAGTRHNVGFDALVLFANRLKAEPKPFLLSGQRVGDIVVDAQLRFALLWPLTYMNRSGGPVIAALRELHADPAQMLVLTDDFHLDLGGLRARASGSSGGHNGLRSIEDSLGCQDPETQEFLPYQEFARLRIGVGSPKHSSVEFVLENFRPGETETVEETLMTASWAAEDWAMGTSSEEIQARYNRRKPQA